MEKGSTRQPYPDSLTEQSLQQRIGQVVRTTRVRRAMSAQALADASGVSLRLIRQLEAGRANIALGRLFRVTRALDLHIASAILPWETDTREIAEFALYESASEPLRKRARRAFRRALQRVQPRTITLLGLRGAGKTSVGSILAKRLSIPFIELDAEIERAAGLTLPEIFELHGASFYRKLEFARLQEVIQSPQPMVIAVSGGVVQQSHTYALILQHTTAVWLKAAPDVHMQRVRDQGDLRPMRDREDAMAELRTILERRTPLYSQADITVDTSTRSLDDVVSTISQFLSEFDTY